MRRRRSRVRAVSDSAATSTPSTRTVPDVGRSIPLTRLSSVDFPDRLSGGEQQRVAVARALVHEPALVLADEPTGNLDAESAGQVLALLAGLARREGKTVIAASHSEEVAALSDRVFTLADGRLLERPAR